MNLQACPNCAVVLDADLLNFPPILDDNYDLSETNAAWDGDSWVAVTQCPVCHGEILQKNGETA